MSAAAYAERAVGNDDHSKAPQGGVSVTERGSAGAAGRMQIALILERLMKGQSQAQVARATGVSGGTINRYLSWRDQSRLKVSTTIAIAAACGGTAEELDYLAHLVRMQDDGWWVAGNLRADSLLDPLLSFEAVAEVELVYASAVVPGLFQTEAYAEALHQDPGADPSVIEARVKARLTRQDVALDRSDLHLAVVLDQGVLQRAIGSPDVMAEQLDHLVTMARRPNITLRVLPFAAGAPAGGGGHFVVLGWQDEREPKTQLGVVYVELHRRGLYLDDPGDVRSYRVLFDDLCRQAADEKASLDLLTTARSEYAS